VLVDYQRRNWRQKPAMVSSLHTFASNLEISATESWAAGPVNSFGGEASRTIAHGLWWRRIIPVPVSIRGKFSRSTDYARSPDLISHKITF